MDLSFSPSCLFLPCCLPPLTHITVSPFPSQTSMVSVEGLTKLVDPSQLTEEFDGSLDYNHEEWIELRLSLEEFFNSAVHLLSRLEDLQEMLARKEFPVDVEGSRRLIDEHTQLKKKVLKAPVEELDREGQRLLQCIRCSDGFSGRNCIPGSADFQSLVPKITSLLDKLHSTRQHLHQMWHVRKLKLDQCFQLRLFEQDAEKVGRGWAKPEPRGVGPNFMGTLLGLLVQISGWRSLVEIPFKRCPLVSESLNDFNLIFGH